MASGRWEFNLTLYPAFARTIAAYIARGQKPVAVAVLLSDDWRCLFDAPKACIRPDEWRRGRFEFGYLAGLHAVAVLGPGATLQAFGEMLIEIMLAAPRLIWVYDTDGQQLVQDDSPTLIAQWVRELFLPNPAPEALESARTVYLDAQKRAEAQDMREQNIIQARGGLERAVRWRIGREEWRKRGQSWFG